MKRGSLILALLLLGGLMIFSQALAAGQSQHASPQGDAVRSGIQTQEQMRAQEQMRIQDPSAAQLLNQEQIREMQRLLTQRGYDIGSVDGVVGSDTMEAIRQFQDSEGLTVTGMHNRETLRALAPTSEQQEFFGLSPEFGEIEE